MKAIIPSSFLNSSKDIHNKSNNEEFISPIKKSQIMDISQAKALERVSFAPSKTSVINPDLRKLKNFKKRQTLRRTNRANAKIQQSIEDNIEEAKNYGFNGRFFNYNPDMQKYNDFLNFPWEDYNHDDFFSFMVSHNKTIPE